MDGRRWSKDAVHLILHPEKHVYGRVLVAVESRKGSEEVRAKVRGMAVAKGNWAKGRGARQWTKGGGKDRGTGRWSNGKGQRGRGAEGRWGGGYLASASLACDSGKPIATMFETCAQPKRL